jgi:UDP-glucose 4-epimerase
MQGGILITGGCGFIGTSLVSDLLQVNPKIPIWVLDNFVSGTPEDLAEVAEYSEKALLEETGRKGGVVLVEGDVRDAGILTRITRGIDCVIHLAANTGVERSVEYPRLDMECNVIGTFNVLEAARENGVKKVVFASSGAPVGEVDLPIHEELPPHPVSPYGASKLAGEGYCSAYNRTFGIDTVCLRFGNVYGPRSKRKSSLVAKFIRQVLAGERCVIYGDGAQTRDFIYIDDLIRAVTLCLQKNVGGEIVQIATGIEHTVDEVAGIIAKAFEKRGVKMTIEYDVPRLGDIKRNFADTRKAARLLGWMVETELEEGIEKTIEYFLSTGLNCHERS